MVEDYLEENLPDFPDVEELQSMQADKDDIYKKKLQNILGSIAGDLVTKSAKQGESSHTLTFGDNVMGFVKDEREKFLSDVMVFIEGKGLKVTREENTFKIDWSKN